MPKFHKYHGAGNDFILVDNRTNMGQCDSEQIRQWCGRRFGIGADGFIVLSESEKADFKMKYYNSDGHPSTLCGNGGRCVVAFAQRLGIIETSTRFEVGDLLLGAKIEQADWVQLQMPDCPLPTTYGSDYLLDTGSPHYLRFGTALGAVNVQVQGESIRYATAFHPDGINVNFIQEEGHKLHIRTYERGVEGETWACGTGVTAAALTHAWRQKINAGTIEVQARGGRLEVSFEQTTTGFQNIWLAGPVSWVFEGQLPDC